MRLWFKPKSARAQRWLWFIGLYLAGILAVGIFSLLGHWILGS